MAPRSKYRWNEAAGRYVDASGQFVSRLQVRRELDFAIAQHERAIRRLSEQLRTNRITLEAWRTGMRAEIKAVHLYSAAAARGGWAQMSPAAYGQVGALVRAEYGHLERFARQIARGGVRNGVRFGPLALDGKFLARAAQYIRAGRDTYHRAERGAMESRGFTQERNVLHPAEHCDGPGSCVEQTGRGWVAIGSLIPIGQRLCRRGCKCTLEYRRSAA